MMKDVIKKVLDNMIPVVCEGIEEKDIDDIKESYIKKKVMQEFPLHYFFTSSWSNINCL